MAEVIIERVTHDTIARYLGSIVMHPDASERLKWAIDVPLIFLVAKVGGVVVGQVGINPNSPTRDDTRVYIPYPTPAIAFMHVAPNLRRQGIGGALLAEAIRVARDELNAGGVYLTVAQENVGAQALYTENGFVDWGHGNIEMPQFEQLLDGAWPEEPVNTTMVVMVRGLQAVQ